MYNKKEREQYNQHREYVCEALGITKNQYNSFRRDGERLRKHYENDCNGYQDINGEWDEVATERAGQIEEQIEDRVEEEVKELGLFIYFQKDCRGATIYLDMQPIPENNYTTAYCIY